MTNKVLPKVLVISTNAWKDNSSINTLIELFKCWDPQLIAQVYTKSLLPKTTICNNFFSISESAVVKSIVHRSVTTGRVVYNETSEIDKKKSSSDKTINAYKSINGLLRKTLFYCREVAWKFGKWKTKELDEFLDNFDADILFIPIYPTIYMCRIQKYIINKTNKKVVSYLADDNYTYKSINKNLFSLLHRYFLRKYVKFIVDHSEKLMVIAPKQKEEYDRIFGVDSIILTKGVDFEPFVKYDLNKPIKMVYTGKLIIGRWKSLAAIAEAFSVINRDSTKITLDIYTTDDLSDEQRKLLNRNGCFVKGSLTLDKVNSIQKTADILVFVESLEDKYKNVARLSFSTKITDYLQKGKCIFAIGDSEIAPIDYFLKFDSAITATNYDEIIEKLNLLVNNTNLVLEYAKKAYNCGVLNHNRQDMDNLLISTIKQIAGI